MAEVTVEKWAQIAAKNQAHIDRLVELAGHHAEKMDELAAAYAAKMLNELVKTYVALADTFKKAVRGEDRDKVEHLPFINSMNHLLARIKNLRQRMGKFDRWSEDETKLGRRIEDHASRGIPRRAKA